ncbi:MAG TPA: hypothetical protein VMW11_01705 [Candidatus Dormibacteraeota bacterium]|nr:hypothetical protein [Candidatus Dormibacteraeota bacterium]
MDIERRSRTAVLWGVVLVAVGLFLLTQTLGLIPSIGGDLAGVALAIAGLALLVSYLALRTHWWTLIAGPVLLGLGGAILLPGDVGGAVFLAAIGLGFVLVFLTDVRRWWAIIPAGTMLTLAVIAAIGSSIDGKLSGSLLFFGLAVTFGVLAAIPVHGHLMRWPVYPALGLLAFGVLTATGGSAAAILWPLVLVAVGIFLVIRASMRPAGPSGPGR